MKKIIFLFFITGFLFLFLFFPKKVFSENTPSGSSAKLLDNLKISIKKTEFFSYKIKELAITNILERYNSSLKEEAGNFIITCKKYNLDCYLLPSIAGVESTFGKFILPNSYNPFGWGGGYIIFENWQQAIDTVGLNLRENYINKWNLLSVEEIGSVYSESSTWAKKVNWFINEFKKEEENLLLLYSKFNVEL